MPALLTSIPSPTCRHLQHKISDLSERLDQCSQVQHSFDIRARDLAHDPTHHRFMATYLPQFAGAYWLATTLTDITDHSPQPTDGNCISIMSNPYISYIKIQTPAYQSQCFLTPTHPNLNTHISAQPLSAFRNKDVGKFPKGDEFTSHSPCRFSYTDVRRGLNERRSTICCGAFIKHA